MSDNHSARSILSNHSWAYMEIINLIAVCEHHRSTCTSVDCGVSTYLLGKTAERLIKYLLPQEKQDAIIKITDMKWM